MLTQQKLCELVHYDEETGAFTWIKARRGVRVGATTGTVNAQGYVVLGVEGKLYLAHRLAWLYMTGAWPTETIDHRNLRRADNRWSNLRQASYSLNNANVGVRGNNTSGETGVSFCPHRKRWRAYISLHGKRRSLGRFKTVEAAASARAAAERQYFGEFRHADNAA